MSLREEALRLHSQARGKWEIASKVPLEHREHLNLAYTPGVAEPCLEIKAHPETVYTYTGKGNLVAVVSDGSAVLGLGNIGPAAALPVMEGKCILFKQFAGVDAVPLVLDTQDVEEIIRIVKAVAPGFGGINLEDIAAPRCFEIEKRLKAELSIPVFHDDQHGTAVVILAALLNAVRVVGKKLPDCRVVISGAGAAGSATSRLLLQEGVAELIVVDRHGILNREEDQPHTAMAELASITNANLLHGDMAAAILGADVFIGLSGPGVLSAEQVRSMKDGAIVFAMANPTPEIFPEEALAGGATIVGTGRSDFPNQINNVLCFPGIFRGALDVQASDISEGMKRAAASAIAALIDPADLNATRIIVDPFDPRVAPAIASAVAKAARQEGIAHKAK